MLVDYHVHLEQGGFTLSWVEEFLTTARSRGVDEICFTEHSYRFHQAHGLLDNDWARAQEEADLDEYVRVVQEARAAGYPVKLGIEMDYVPGKEAEIGDFLARYPFDLVLGSVHWLEDWGIDIDPAFWRGRDVTEVYRLYFATLEKAAGSGLFDVLSHPDLVKIFNFRPQEDVGESVEAAVAAAAESGVCLEVSSAGLRKPVGEIYPDFELLILARSHGISITIASDAHHPRHVGQDFPRLVEYARAAGYEESAVFSGRRRVLAPFGTDRDGEEGGVD